MSQPANDDFSQHLSDDEASYHEDASENGTSTNKPNQQQQLIPTTTTISNIKLPILKKEEYDIWAMEMEHYLEYIDNNIWKERKARTILLMAIPKEHLRRFHGMDDAKEIWEAIRTRFGGNANSKKMQKAFLKQQFEAFTISSSEGLEKGYDRFQQLLSQLEAHGDEVSTEDANHTFLRSLPPAWSNLAMTMRTKPDVDTLSIDDLYNNLRAFEQELTSTTKSFASAQNVAFVLHSKSSTNKVNSGHTGAYSTCTPTSSNNIQEIEVPAGFADEVIYSLFAKQSKDLDLLHEDLEQIDDIDIEEMDINWQIAMIAIRMKKFYKMTGRRFRIDGNKPRSIQQGTHSVVNWGEHTVEEEETNHALMAISSNNELGKQEAKILAYTLAVKKLEAQVVTFQKQQLSLNEQLTFQANEIYAKDEKLKKYRRLGMKAVKEKEQLQKRSNSQNDQGIFDSGCSRHMTGNKSFLTDYQEIDGGFVAFAGSPKGGKKQHKPLVSQLVSSISQTLTNLHMDLLHMDLFGPTSVRSINHKTYCLVVTDDYSRFSWVFFLATKDETSGILKTFITGIENQINHKVKIIRCDNGTEFKNNDMNQFCGMKGIKREFSVARTPQQNGVAERKNRTLIEAARTMLADSLLPTTFWAEAVSTACYVQNRVLVTKPHNKTPYELLHGRPPSISFMRPFGCPVTILNTLDPLGKFDGKADEGFFVGYSINSKAFRVFNTRTRKVEENLHITFLENKPNVAGSGPDWLFDIDLLTNSMNYEPVTARNQTNKNAEDAVADDAGKKTNEKPVNEGERNGQEKEGGASNKEGYATSTNRVSTVSTAGQSFDNADDLPTDPLMPDLEDTTDLLNTGIFSGAYNDEDVGAEADLNNLETTMNVSRIPTTRIYKDHPKDQFIGDINSATQTMRMTKISEEHALVRTQEGDSSFGRSKLGRGNARGVATILAYASFMGFIVYQMDVKSAFLYGTIEEEVEKALYGLHQAPRAWYETLSTYLLENGFRRGTIDKTLFIKNDKGDILLVQLYVNDIIFGSTKKSLCVEFELMMHKRFQMSSMGELTFFLGLQVKQKDDGIFISQDKYVADIFKKIDFATVKTASTPIEINKALLKDEEAEDVDVHLYRDSPFDLEAFFDSDYVGASLDRKSTTGGCQFLGKRLISWQCKKQTIVANSTTEVEYVAAASRGSKIKCLIMGSTS
ncbi:retrovirus-related pol polyprotein from transposon TNT 1-94 [Tanacetum coccineum]